MVIPCHPPAGVPDNISIYGCRGPDASKNILNGLSTDNAARRNGGKTPETLGHRSGCRRRSRSIPELCAALQANDHLAQLGVVRMGGSRLRTHLAPERMQAHDIESSIQAAGSAAAACGRPGPLAPLEMIGDAFRGQPGRACAKERQL